MPDVGEIRLRRVRLASLLPGIAGAALRLDLLGVCCVVAEGSCPEHLGLAVRVPAGCGRGLPEQPSAALGVAGITTSGFEAGTFPLPQGHCQLPTCPSSAGCVR